jgi:hypothetical protein
MTQQEYRDLFLRSQLSPKKLTLLKTQGIYDKYISGEINFETVFNQMKDRGI